MKVFLTALLLFFGSQNLSSMTPSSSVLLGEYIDCYIATNYGLSNLSQIIGNELRTSMLQPNEANDNRNDALITVSENVKKHPGRSKELIEKIKKGNIASLGPYFDKYLVIPRRDNHRIVFSSQEGDPDDNHYEFYIVTTSGAHKYRFKPELLSEGQSRYAFFTVRPRGEGIRHWFNVRYLQSPTPFQPSIYTEMNFSTLRQTPRETLNGERMTDNSLYYTVLLDRIIAPLQPNYTGRLKKENLTQREYNFIVRACRPLMKEVPVLKESIERWKPESKN